MYVNKWRGLWKKISIIICILSALTLFIHACKLIIDWQSRPKDNLKCFDISGNKLNEFDEYEPVKGSGIFFHETSCPKDFLDMSVNARQACSIESALRTHPNKDVFFLITSPIFKSLEEIKNILIKQLLTYKNLKIRHITFSRYLANTPLEKIYTTGALNYSLWPVPHSSDVLRYTTLYKFGGIYLDLDVIVLKSLSELKNFVGAESDIYLGSGILGFSYDKIGREVATKCAEELAGTFDGRKWGFNGPGVITRVLGKICKTDTIAKMLHGSCKGFQIYPENYFSPLSYNEIELFFKEGNIDKVRKLLNNSYTIHYWNKLSSQYSVKKNIAIPFLNYAQKYCPKIYNIINGTF